MASFTSKVKEELAKIQIKNDPSALSELAGIIHCSATVTIGRGGVALRLVTENKNTVNLIFALVRRLYKTDCELSQTLNQMKKESIPAARLSQISLLIRKGRSHTCVAALSETVS